MNLTDDQLSREKIQQNVFKLLLLTIVCFVIVFLIKQEGFFFGI